MSTALDVPVLYVSIMGLTHCYKTTVFLHLYFVQSPTRSYTPAEWYLTFSLWLSGWQFVLAEVKVAKFCMQVEHTKCYHWDDRLPFNGQGHMTRFLIFAPIIIFGIDEARHFKFRALNDTQ